MSRTTPWGANIAKAANGDPYQDADITNGENCAQAMTKAGLDWTVELVNVQASTTKRLIPRHKAVVRSDTGEALGIVGRIYTPIFNMDLATFTDALTADADDGVSGVGSLDGGRRVYTVVNLGDWRPPGMGDEEVISNSLVAFTRHDGGSSLTATYFPMRLACTNGMLAVVQHLVKAVRIRHTASAPERIVEARRVMGLAQEGMTTFQAEVEKLIETSITDRKFAKLVEDLLPITDDTSPSTDTKRRTARVVLVDTYLNSENLGNIRGTAWGAVNTVAEYEQWLSPSRVDRSAQQMAEITSGRTRQGLTSRAVAILS